MDESMWKFEIEKVAETVLDLCYLFNCSVDVAWNEYTHTLITDQFTLEEVKDCLRKHEESVMALN